MRPTSTIKIFFVYLCLLFAALPCWAAQQGVGVSLISFTLDTSHQVNIGYTITINAQVTNFDSVPFNGFINFGLHNDQQVLSNTSIFDKPPYSGDSISLGGGETVPAVFSININHPYFSPGPDVVVVWPICTQPIADSILIHLDILDPNSINDLKDLPVTYAVVNNTILFKTTDAKINFKQVRIFNDLGQKLADMGGNLITSMPVPIIARGIYFCELTTEDGRRVTFKFIAPGN